MMRSDENERSESLYSTVRYNLTCWEEKLFTLSLLKMKSKMGLDASVEVINHHQRSMTHRQLKMTWDWAHYAIMLSYEAVLAFASTLDESTTCVSYRCAQTMNAAIASDHLIIMIYYASAFIEARRDKYVYQKS